jgi:hypothetical protein
MNSNMFKLNLQDVAKGLIVAVLAAVVTFLGNALNAPGFDFVTFDWGTLLSVAMTAGLGYLAKNFLSDTQGKFGGVL